MFQDLATFVKNMGVISTISGNCGVICLILDIVWVKWVRVSEVQNMKNGNLTESWNLKSKIDRLHLSTHVIFKAQFWKPIIRLKWQILYHLCSKFFLPSCLFSHHDWNRNLWGSYFQNPSDHQCHNRV